MKINQIKDKKEIEAEEFKSITIKGNTIKYKNRIFAYNHNASKYETKEKRKIYHCQYHYHLINELSRKKLPPFCSMKITYYPDKEDENKFKITGEHSYDCVRKYNEESSDKSEYLDNYDKFQDLCIEAFNKMDHYNRKEYIELAYKILNDNKIRIKINDNKIKNLISKWKINSQKFTKYMFLEDTKTFDGQILLQNYIYKIITYKNKRINFECFIWGNDFFLQRMRYSEYIFVDGTFHFPSGFSQFIIFMYYDQQIERKLPSIFVLTNTKNQVGYEEIFKNIKSILSFGKKYKMNIKTITTDNEQALINVVTKYFPNSQRISCYFHYKQSLERNAKKMGLCKKQYIEVTRIIINKLGELPLIYEGDIDIVTNIIDELKSHYPTHYSFLDSFYEENIKYFINNSLYYSKYPKLVRSNSILENYNKRIKEYLGKKKEVNFINFLSFIKKEDEFYFKEFNLKSRNYGEILKFKNIHKNNVLKEKDNSENSEDSEQLSIKFENIINEEEEELEIDTVLKKGRWLKWISNSCRFDAFMTIYLFILYSKTEKCSEMIKNEGLKILHDSMNSLLENPDSEDRFNFWSYVNMKQLDRGEYPLNFGEMGFISGIFKIFEENKYYCLSVKK